MLVPVIAFAVTAPVLVFTVMLAELVISSAYLAWKAKPVLVICWRGLIGRSEEPKLPSPLSTTISRKRSVPSAKTVLKGTLVLFLSPSLPGVGAGDAGSPAAIPETWLPMPKTTLNSPSEMVAVCSSVQMVLPPLAEA